MYGYVIFVRYPFDRETEYVYSFRTDEKRANDDYKHCQDYAKDNAGTSYRMARAELNELPDDIDADNERTMQRIRTADEMHSTPDYSYLDHPALS